MAFLLIIPLFSLVPTLLVSHVLSCCFSWYSLVALLSLAAESTIEALRGGLQSTIYIVPLYTLSEGLPALPVNFLDSISLSIGLRYLGVQLYMYLSLVSVLCGLVPVRVSSFWYML